MTDTSKDAGVIQVLVERFEKHRLPRILELKEKVDNGERLNDIDIAYLEEIIEDAQQHKALVDQHPEWHQISAQVASLYQEITRKALENEKGA
jgi:predicted RNase H-like nuclease